jgi:two-component sensor histidine kinase
VATNLIEHPAVSGVVVNARDITERVHVEERLKASLRDKETLLKEIHHRVKNNLQVVASLLSLQSGYVQDAATQQLFEESQHRIRSMALVHERLYQSQDLARIDFAEYVNSLVTHLFSSYHAQGIKWRIEADPIALDIDTAVPCGLILNELVTNALKHGFPDGRGGEVYVGVREADGRYAIVVQDDGVGFQEAVDFHNAASLGLQLVNSLVRQLGGAIELCRLKGTKFEITFVGVRDGAKELTSWRP